VELVRLHKTIAILIANMAAKLTRLLVKLHIAIEVDNLLPSLLQGEGFLFAGYDFSQSL
jgi:hypothetical protein